MEKPNTFYQPRQKAYNPLVIKVNPLNSVQFREFINNKLNNPYANVDNFQCPKLNEKLMNEYGLILISKVNTDKNFSRVVADICLAIFKKNKDFITVIAAAGKKIFSLLLTNKKSICGFLEFFTILNKKYKSKAGDNLIKFAIFEVLESSWIGNEQNYIVMRHFLQLNKNIIERMPKYVAGDIDFYYKNTSTPDEEVFTNFDPEYPQTFLNDIANPSLKYAANLHKTERIENYGEYFDDPKDIRIIDPNNCGIFIVFNATRCGRCDHFQPYQYAKLTKYIIDNSPDDKNVKKFYEKVLHYVKERFFHHHIKADQKERDHVVIGTVLFVIELYHLDLMDDKYFKVFLKVIIDLYATDENPVIEACNRSLLEKAYLEKYAKHHDDINLGRFMQRSIVLSEEVRKLKEENKFFKENGEKKKEVKKEKIKKKTKKCVHKRQKSTAPYNHDQIFPAFKSAVESLAFDKTKFDLTNVHESKMQDYIDYIITLIEQESSNFSIYFAKIAAQFDETFGDELFTKLFSSISSKEVSSEIKRKFSIFSSFLYVYHLISTEHISMILAKLYENETVTFQMTFTLIFEKLVQYDPQLFYEYSDKRPEFNEDVFLSFQGLVKSIIDNEEVHFEYKIEDYQKSAKFFYTCAIQDQRRAENIADFLATTDDAVLCFEVIKLLMEDFEDLKQSELNYEELLGAGALLAELHKVDLIGYRIIEDCFKSLPGPEASEIHIIVFQTILKRIYDKAVNSGDYGMKKLLKSELVQSFQDDKLDIVFEESMKLSKLSEFYDRDINLIKKDIVTKFIKATEDKDKANMIAFLKKLYKSDQTFKTAASAILMCGSESTECHDIIIEVLSQFPMDKFSLRAPFKEVIDFYYPKVLIADFGCELEVQKVVNFEELTVRLLNDSFIKVEDLVSYWDVRMKKLAEVGGGLCSSWFFMSKFLKIVDKNILRGSIQQLDCFKTELLKIAKVNVDVKLQMDYFDIFDKLGVSFLDFEQFNKKSKKRNKKDKVVDEVKSENEEKPPSIESEAAIVKEVPVKEVKSPPFDIDAFKLILIETKSTTLNQLNDKIKSIKVESEKSLKIMAREFLNAESSSKVAEMINDNFHGFKEVLEKEIVMELTLMLKSGILDAKENLEICSSNIKTSHISTEILQNFHTLVVKVEYLLNLATELFNIGWMSFDNLQDLLEFFIINRNFEMASKILKKTSLKLSKSDKVLKLKSELDYVAPQSISEYHHCVNFIGQLNAIQKIVEGHSQRSNRVELKVEGGLMEDIIKNLESLTVEEVEKKIEEVPEEVKHDQFKFCNIM